MAEFPMAERHNPQVGDCGETKSVLYGVFRLAFKEKTAMHLLNWHS